MTYAARSTSRGATLAFALGVALVACAPREHHVAVGTVSSTSTLASPPVAQPTMPLPATVLVPAARANASGPASKSAATRAIAPTASGAPVVAPGTHILSIATTPTIVHDGDTVAWDVRTTSDVVDVLAHVTAYSFRFQRQAPGRFRLQFTIPKGVPGFFHGTYHMNVVARANDGATDASTVAVVFE